MEYILNKTPIRTTNNFGINDIKLDLNIKETSFNDYIFSSEKNLIINKEIKNDFESKIGLKSNKYLDLVINPKKNIDKLIINYNFDEKNNYLASFITINLDYDMNAIICFRGNNSFLNFKLKVKDTGNNKSNITIVNLCNDSSTSFISIENEVNNNSNNTINYIDISGKVRVSNYYSIINGLNGISNFNTIFIGDNDDRLDMNYYTKNNNSKTISNMIFEGVLLGNSYKSLKGIIDFTKNSKSSKGDEKENCLLLSDNCKSKSLPMLLCEEEDVEGSHSLSSGKIDEDKLFYLMCRGLSKKESILLIVKSNFKPILDNIFDDNIKNEVINIIDKKIGD